MRQSIFFHLLLELTLGQFLLWLLLRQDRDGRRSGKYPVRGWIFGAFVAAVRRLFATKETAQKVGHGFDVCYCVCNVYPKILEWGMMY